MNVSELEVKITITSGELRSLLSELKENLIKMRIAQLDAEMETIYWRYMYHNKKVGDCVK
jgi:hypothetical protein